MEIELSNGQLKFWQWDTEQKVKVPENVPTVHFKFGSFARGFPVADRWVKVPDELLQTGKDILLWTYKEDHTLDAARIPVEKKPKPAGYAYTPTEIKTWEALDKRIEALEKGGGVAGVSSVNGQTGAVTITASGIGAATPDEVTSTVNSAWAEAQKTLEPLFDAKQPKGDYITQDGLQTATNAALAQAKASGEFDGAQGPKGDPGATGPQGPAGAGLNVTGATVGQTVKISAVDDNGAPTAWVPVDMAEDGGTSEVSWHAWDNVIVPEGGLNAFDFTTLASGEKLSDHQVKGMFIYSPIAVSTAASDEQSATLIVNGDYAFNLKTFARGGAGYLRLLLTVENGQLVVRYFKRDTDNKVTFPATTVTINSEGLHSAEDLIKGATTVIGYGQTLKTFSQIKSVRIESSGQVAKGVEFDVQVLY